MKRLDPSWFVGRKMCAVHVCTPFLLIKTDNTDERKMGLKKERVNMCKTKRVNKITKSLYSSVKRMAPSHIYDGVVAEKYGIGVDTVARIRRSKSYEDYREKYSGRHDLGGRRGKIIDLDNERANEEIDSACEEIQKIIEDLRVSCKNNDDASEKIIELLNTFGFNIIGEVESVKNLCIAIALGGIALVIYLILKLQGVA